MTTVGNRTPNSRRNLVGIIAMTTRPNHCCPACGNPVGAKRWFWTAWIWAKWNCIFCGTLLRFDLRRRLMLGLLLALLYMLMTGIAVIFGEMSDISPWTWALPVLAIIMVAPVLIFIRGDRVIVAQQRKGHSHALPKDA